MSEKGTLKKHFGFNVSSKSDLKKNWPSIADLIICLSVSLFECWLMQQREEIYPLQTRLINFNKTIHKLPATTSGLITSKPKFC
jgi:hypothetical protein